MGTKHTCILVIVKYYQEVDEHSNPTSSTQKTDNIYDMN